MLKYFIPITILSTPIGQVTGDRISTEIIEAVGGFLVTFVACFEMYQKRQLFHKWFHNLLRGFGINIDLRIHDSNDDHDDNHDNDAIDRLDRNDRTNYLNADNSDSRDCYNKQLEQLDMSHMSYYTHDGHDQRSGKDHSNSHHEHEHEHHPFHELYTLHDKLGEGKFSIVMEGIHRETCKHYAVKVITKALSGEEQELKLQQEIDLLRQVKQHPHIVQLHESYNEIDYLTFNNINGFNLNSCCLSKRRWYRNYGSFRSYSIRHD